MATKQSTNEKTKVEQPKTNKQDNAKNNIQQTPINTKEETKAPEPKKEVKKIDLSKYSHYENALNGGYKAYVKSDSEMNFYYMGQFDVIEVRAAKKKDNNGKERDIAKFQMKMHHAVREDLLRYLQSSIKGSEK